MKPFILAGFVLVLVGGAMGQTPPIVPNGAVTYGCMTDGHGNCLDQSWRLITQTYGGRIGIRKGLTEQECEHDRLKAMNQPADDQERAFAKRFQDEDKAADKCTAEPKTNIMICTVGALHPAYIHISSDIRRALCEKQQ